MAHEQVRISDLKPNPFRDMEHYPIQEHKIEQLIQSYKETNFWGNIVGRKRGAKKVEIAYGHHRLEALKRYPGLKQSSKVSIIVEDLDDEQMLKIMANENMEEWETSAEVTHETIRAVVQAYADGKIELEEPSQKGQLARYAPSFILGNPSPAGEGFPYNRKTVASFLGWPLKRVEATLHALAQQEEKILPEDFVEGLGVKDARLISDNVSKVQAPYEQSANEWEEDAKVAEEEGDKEKAEKYQRTAKARRKEGKKAAQGAAKKVSRDLKSGKITGKDIPQAVRGFSVPKNKKPPDIEDVAGQVTKALNKMLTDENNTMAKLEELIEWKQKLDEDTQRELYQALEGVGERATKLANKIRVKLDSKPKLKMLKGAN